MSYALKPSVLMAMSSAYSEPYVQLPGESLDPRKILLLQASGYFANCATAKMLGVEITDPMVVKAEQAFKAGRVDEASDCLDEVIHKKTTEWMTETGFRINSSF